MDRRVFLSTAFISGQPQTTLHYHAIPRRLSSHRHPPKRWCLISFRMWRPQELQDNPTCQFDQFYTGRSKRGSSGAETFILAIVIRVAAALISGRPVLRYSGIDRSIGHIIILMSNSSSDDGGAVQVFLFICSFVGKTPSRLLLLLLMRLHTRTDSQEED